MTRTGASAFPIKEIRSSDASRHSLARNSLEGLLGWVREQEETCLALLRRLPWETAEYSDAMERLDRLHEQGAQVRLQLVSGKHT